MMVCAEINSIHLGSVHEIITLSNDNMVIKTLVLSCFPSQGVIIDSLGTTESKSVETEKMLPFFILHLPSCYQSYGERICLQQIGFFF